jgi:hypothetical protein
VDDPLLDQVERIKDGVRAKVEHPFRVIKHQGGRVKVRYWGLEKETAQFANAPVCPAQPLDDDEEGRESCGMSAPAGCHIAAETAEMQCDMRVPQ